MKSQSKETVFVAMSGGVDSSVASALLKERGFDVRGVHIKMWSDPEIPCTFKEDRLDAMRVAAHLGIPFETWDFTKEYRAAVVEYMIREYAVGRTPNPDVMCNREIKFGIFLKRALERGADFIATGHYTHVVPFGISSARHARSPATRSLSIRRGVPPSAGTMPPRLLMVAQEEIPRPRVQLLKAQDLNKDQSYFLWTLTQEQLRHCLFPIGEYTKPQVREMARKFGLPTAEKKDSQGICFIGEIDLPRFLHRYIPVRRGLVCTTNDKVVGEHEGLAFYTIGQREGIGIGGGIPYYVAKKDFATNTLVVAEGPYEEKLFSRELDMADVNWITGVSPKLPLRCEARIRYRQPLQSCRIEAENHADKPQDNAEFSVAVGVRSASVRVRFAEAQRAITPGQSIVFYQGDEMIGGGCIL